MNRALRLTCVECGATSEDGLGWRAFLVGVHDELDDEETVAGLLPDVRATRVR